jgi:hypothetical protein
MEPTHQTRSQTLKRDLQAVAEDEEKQRARKAFEPMMKRAKTALVTTSVSHPDAEEALLDEEERAELVMVFNLFDKY